MRQLHTALLAFVAVSFAVIAHAQTAEELDAAARQAYATHDFQRAAAIAKQVYQLRAAALPAGDQKVVTAALNAGLSLLHAESYSDAITFLDIACKGAEQLFGQRHANVGSCLLDLAAALAHTGPRDEAQKTAAKALSIIKEAYPPEAYAAAQFRAGEIFRDAKDPETAIAYFLSAVESYARLDSRTYLATSLSEAGQLLYETSRLSDAAVALERAISLRRAQDAELSPNTVALVYMLADCYRRVGEYDKALPLLADVATQVAKVRDETHLSSDDILLEVAEAQNDNGSADAALATCQIVLDRVRATLTDAGRIRETRAFVLVARIHDEQHQFTAAEDAYDSAIKTAEGITRDNGNLRSALASLAFHFLRRGRYAEARSRLDDALALAEKSDGAKSVSVAELLEQITVALINANDSERARPLIARAREIYTTLRPQSRELVRALKISARCTDNDVDRSRFMAEALTLQKQIGEDFTPDFFVDTAREAQRRRDLEHATANVEAALALDPSDTVGRDVLAGILEDRKDFARATALATEAIQLAARNFGPDSINVAGREFNLGRLLLRACDVEQARRAFLMAATAFRDHTVRLFSSLSLAEQRQLLDQQASAQISGSLSACEGNPCLADAYDLIVSWKGLLIDGLRRQVDIARAIEAQRNSPLAARWKTVRGQLAEWETARGERPYDEWRKISDTLAQEKEALERKLLQTNLDTGSHANLSVADVRQVLRDDETLVDIYRYSKFTDAIDVETRYGAILLSKHDVPKLITFDAHEIDAAIAGWRTAIASDSSAPWLRLRDRVWKPLRRALPANTRVVRVSADGELVKVPWHEFAGSGPIEVTEIDSARFLVRARLKTMPPPATRRILILGGIDYDVGRTKRSPGRPGVPFPFLKWTTQEAQSIAQLAAANYITSVVLKTDAATKQAVLENARAATYIHLATHAYVSGEPQVGLNGRGWVIGAQHKWSRNVLIDSGVALSAANVRDPRTLTTSGTLSAEELIDADLSASDLVVLSACSTDLGADSASQGLLGLRSALLAAGAKRLLLSLWNVDDEATELLMAAFYRALWSSPTSIATALHHAQDEVRKSNSRFRAPKYWAGWVVVDPE